MMETHFGIPPSSEEDLLGGGKDVPEHGGEQVQHRCDDEEGLEGSQALHHVARSHGADDGRQRPHRVGHACSSSIQNEIRKIQTIQAAIWVK